VLVKALATMTDQHERSYLEGRLIKSTPPQSLRRASLPFVLDIEMMMREEAVRGESVCSLENTCKDLGNIDPAQVPEKAKGMAERLRCAIADTGGFPFFPTLPASESSPANAVVFSCPVAPEGECPYVEPLWKAHRSQRMDGPNWENSNPALWLDKPWEVAKLFMLQGAKVGDSASDMDASALCNLCDHLKLPGGETEEHKSLRELAKRLRRPRNQAMHAKG
jgi:hypothetical protein